MTARARAAEGPPGGSAVLARSPLAVRWLAAVVQTSRPRQWPKNLLVFAAPLAAASLGRDDGLAYALVAAVVFTIVNRTSALNFPLSRICHNATTISVGGIMVIRLLLAARHRISNAASAATTVTTRATAALVNRNDMPEAATDTQNGLCHVSGRNR